MNILKLFDQSNKIQSMHKEIGQLIERNDRLVVHCTKIEAENARMKKSLDAAIVQNEAVLAALTKHKMDEAKVNRANDLLAAFATLKHTLQNC